MVSITDSPGDNQFVLYGQSQIGGLTLNFAAGSNLVNVYDATIHGSTTINLGISGIGSNEVEFGNAAGDSATDLDGQVTVNMGDGRNIVDIAVYETTNFASSLSNIFTANTSPSNSISLGVDVTGNVPIFKNF